MGISIKRPLRRVPQNAQDFEKFFRDDVRVRVDATGNADIAANAVATTNVVDKAITLSKIADLAADRILGRLTSSGAAQELTATQVVTLLQAVAWVFADTVQFNGNVGFYGTAPQAQPTHIPDAETAHALNATFSDTEVEAALDALGGKVNSVIAMLETLGLKASS